jgi:glycosyltransferase involved in cell wall biosynthesis
LVPSGWIVGVRLPGDRHSHVKLALVIPGGVDRSGEYRVIPALLALIRRLSRAHELHVYALQQEAQPAHWRLCGALIHNTGGRRAVWRAIRTINMICAEHRTAPFQVIQSIWSGAPGVIAVTAARLLGIPSAVHVAGGEIVSIPNIAYGGRLTWKGRVREALTLGAATVVTAASAPMIEMLDVLGVAAQRVALGVDCETWPVRPPRRRALSGPARLIHIGSINRVKDQATLLEAFAMLVRAGRDAHLDLVGDDTLHGEIQAIAVSLRVDARVTFHGFLTQRTLRPLIEAAHILVMSSRHEAGPYSLLEAAIAGVPTVGTAVGHIAEWAPAAALAAPVADPVALASMIDSLLVDEELRLRVAEQAQRRALEGDADDTVRCFERIYASITQGR